MFGILYGKKGFTLIELIVVVIIVGVLAAVVTPMIRGNVMRARRSEAIAAMGTIRTAERLFISEHGRATYQGESWWGGGLSTLDDYIQPGDLNGAYYSEDCYRVRLDGNMAPITSYTISANPILSKAPRAADVATAGISKMDQDGNITNP